MGQNHRTYGLGHLRSLRAALYPGRGYVGHTPVRRVHGRHSAGSSRVGTRPNTLRIGCTELKAVPHAGLGFHFLRVRVRTNGAWGSARGNRAKSSRSKTASESNRVTAARAHLQKVNQIPKQYRVVRFLA